MDKKIIEKYNYPKILEVDTWEKFKEFRNHFDDDVDKSLALSFWKGNQHRKMWSEELSRVKSREENNDFKRDLARFIYNNWFYWYTIFYVIPVLYVVERSS